MLTHRQSVPHAMPLEAMPHAMRLGTPGLGRCCEVKTKRCEAQLGVSPEDSILSKKPLGRPGLVPWVFLRLPVEQVQYFNFHQLGRFLVGTVDHACGSAVLLSLSSFLGRPRYRGVSIHLPEPDGQRHHLSASHRVRISHRALSQWEASPEAKGLARCHEAQRSFRRMTPRPLPTFLPFLPPGLHTRQCCQPVMCALGEARFLMLDAGEPMCLPAVAACGALLQDAGTLLV